MPMIKASQGGSGRISSDSLQQGSIARLIGVIHDSNGEPLIAKSLPQLIQNCRFTCPDVAVNDSKPALIADGILTDA